MNKKNRIIIFTSSYPYGNGELCWGQRTGALHELNEVEYSGRRRVHHKVKVR